MHTDSIDRPRPSASHEERPAPRARAVQIVLAALVLVAAAMALMPAGAARGAEALDGPGVLTLRDGRSIEGTITENADSVSVTASGVVTTVPRAQVRSIEYGTPEERLNRRLDALPPEDLAGRMAVADEALRRGLLDLAQRVAEDVRRVDPGHPRASVVLDQVERQRQLRLAEGQGVRVRPGEGAGAHTLRPTAQNVLNEEQINKIRQAELRTADAEATRERPRISFRDSVLRRFVESRPDLEFREFNRGNEVQKALFLLSESDDPEIREDVRITSHPTSVLEYLRSIEPVVLNGCATSQCHGGAAASSFALYGEARDEAASYTNFYLLNTTGVEIARKGAGAFAGPDEQGAPVLGRLIDREQPDDSLLLHYMLPPQQARYAHPEVEDFRPLVTGTDSENYQLVRRWIASSLRPLAPANYGFEFRLALPTTGPATQPATQPGTRPANSPQRPPAR